MFGKQMLYQLSYSRSSPIQMTVAAPDPAPRASPVPQLSSFSPREPLSYRQRDSAFALSSRPSSCRGLQPAVLQSRGSAEGRSPFAGVQGVSP